MPTPHTVPCAGPDCTNPAPTWPGAVRAYCQQSCKDARASEPQYSARGHGADLLGYGTMAEAKRLCRDYLRGYQEEGDRIGTMAADEEDSRTILVVTTLGVHTDAFASISRV